jgi:hypothetical protein
METTLRNSRSNPRDLPRPERTVLAAAAVAALVMAVATLSVDPPSTEYALEPVSFDVAPMRADPVIAASHEADAIRTAALSSDVWSADQSASGTRPDATH